MISPPRHLIALFAALERGAQDQAQRGRDQEADGQRDLKQADSDKNGAARQRAPKDPA